MPLDDVKLDERSFDDILSEARLRIPRYTKEWTNFNDSDPGTTLVQLFAWLTDMMLFQMNQVPEKNYRKFLKLLGQDLRPARPATAHLTFAVKAGTVAETVPERAQVAAQLSDGGDPLIFETLRPLDPVQTPLVAVGVLDGSAFLNVTTANNNPGTGFRPFGWAPEFGNALYLGFEDTPPRKDLFPEEIALRVFLPPKATAGVAQSCEANITLPDPPAGLSWEYRSAGGAAPWTRLNLYLDETVAFTREGYIRIQGPGDDFKSYVEPRLGPDPRYWIRCRLETGNYQAGHAPQIDIIRTNTVEAVNLTTVKGEILGVSEGHPDEAFETDRQPVERSSFVLKTERRDGTQEQWKQVDDLLASKPDDLHYRLNATSGRVEFGDATNGRIPDPSSLIIAEQYRYGGGARGNLAGVRMIRTPQSVLVGIDQVFNERPAVGGADEQRVEDLKREAPSILRRRSRAVTPEDFQSLALEAGGIRAAAALPSTHPAHRGVAVPGAVTIVIVPESEDVPPQPSSDLIRSVCRHLDQHRLITTELYVKSPEYQEIRVEARVQARPYASGDTIVRDLMDALNRFFTERLSSFGQDLYPTQVYQALLIRDVLSVPSLRIYVDGSLHRGLGQIPAPPDGLFFGRDHLIVVEPARDQ